MASIYPQSLTGTAFMSKITLLLGAGEFIGSHLVNALKAEGPTGFHGKVSCSGPCNIANLSGQFTKLYYGMPLEQ